MPAYANNPFTPPQLVQKGVPCYLLGSLNFHQANTRMLVTNSALTSNVATLTVQIVEGEIPAIGSLISVQQTQAGSGAFNVSRAAITAVSITAATDPCAATDHCVDADPCIGADHCADADHYIVPDPCAGTDPCIGADHCAIPDPCAATDLCVGTDPCAVIDFCKVNPGINAGTDVEPIAAGQHAPSVCIQRDRIDFIECHIPLTIRTSTAKMAAPTKMSEARLSSSERRFIGAPCLAHRINSGREGVRSPQDWQEK